MTTGETISQLEAVIGNMGALAIVVEMCTTLMSMVANSQTQVEGITKELEACQLEVMALKQATTSPPQVSVEGSSAFSALTKELEACWLEVMALKQVTTSPPQASAEDCQLKVVRLLVLSIGFQKC